MSSVAKTNPRSRSPLYARITGGTPDLASKRSAAGITSSSKVRGTPEIDCASAPRAKHPIPNAAASAPRSRNMRWRVDIGLCAGEPEHRRVERPFKDTAEAAAADRPTVVSACGSLSEAPVLQHNDGDNPSLRRRYMSKWSRAPFALIVGFSVAVTPVAAQQEREDMSTFERPIEMADNVWIEELTALEVRDHLASGTNTALVLVGGIEENGPYLT